MATAYDWGRTPSEFWALGEPDKAYMTAYTRQRGRMVAWENMESKKASQKSHKGNRS